MPKIAPAGRTWQRLLSGPRPSVGADTAGFLAGSHPPKGNCPGTFWGAHPLILRVADRKIHMGNAKNCLSRPNLATPPFRAPSVGAPTQPFFRRDPVPSPQNCPGGGPTLYEDGGWADNPGGKRKRSNKGGPHPPVIARGRLGLPTPYFEGGGSENPHGKSKNCPGRPNRATPPFRAPSVGAPTLPHPLF